MRRALRREAFRPAHVTRPGYIYPERGVVRGIGMPTIDTMLLLGLVVLLLVLGPTKLPQFARAIGDAVREFRRATSAVEEHPPREQRSPPPAPEHRPQAQEPQAQVDTDNAIVAAAIREGIDVRGKTIDQIAEELAKKLKEKRAAASGHM